MAGRRGRSAHRGHGQRILSHAPRSFHAPVRQSPADGCAARQDCSTRGFRPVEIFCARQHLDYRDKAQITELGHWFRDSDLKLHSLHAPMYNDEIWGRSGPHAVITITEPVKGKRLEMVDEIKRALEIAETIPFKYLIQHIGVAGEEFSERAVDAAFSALEQISLFARQRGVEVLLENIPNELSSAERLMLFLESDAPGSELRLRRGSRQHRRRRGGGLRHDEGPHPLHAHPRQRRQGGQAPVSAGGAKAERSTGRKRWTCCARARTSIRCCWS